MNSLFFAGSSEAGIAAIRARKHWDAARGT